MITSIDAHMLDLLASYEERLKVTARALGLDKARADALPAGVLPPTSRSNPVRLPALSQSGAIRGPGGEFQAQVSVH